MIEYKNEYINLVVLGSFNPAILTHEFLIRECGFDLPNEPNQTIPPIPVVASLDYGNLTFFADLGRLEMKQIGCENPESSKLPSYLKTYLEKLPYTPINKCGANFSYELSVEKGRLEQIEEWLIKDRKKFYKVMDVETIDLEVFLHISQGKEAVASWILRTKSRETRESTILKVSPQSDRKVKVDFNYEVSELDKYKKRLENVTTKYGTVFAMFKQQVEKIFAG